MKRDEIDHDRSGISKREKNYKGANFDCFSSLKKKGEMITGLNVS
jgi:hypothetical protein